ncbi:MAG: hypothetical protein GX592_05215, partial [Clostridiales bacterium]|nr:hypothetical protein [Clostridiales bacterium]
GGGAIVGVSVALASINVFSTVAAALEGDVTKASLLSVSATCEYPDVLAATLAASVGGVAVGASVAATVFDAAVEASVRGNAAISQTPEVRVSSKFVADPVAGAGAFAAGGASVNGAIALAINLTRVDTYIGRGATVNRHNSNGVTAGAEVDASSRAYVLSVAVSIGGAAVGLTAAVSVVRPTVLTYIGSTPSGHTENPGANGSGGSVKAGSVRVENKVSTLSRALIAAFSAGGISVNGSALLAFNMTDAAASLTRANVQVDRLDINAYMNAAARSLVLAGTVGGAAIGVTVSYAGLTASNVAEIDNSAVTAANTVNVGAGKEMQCAFAAEAVAVAGNIGLVSAGLNAAIADNNAQNIARIVGGTVAATEKLEVNASGSATAEAKVRGVSVGIGINVAGTFVLSLQRIRQKALISGGTVEVGFLDVKSTLNNASGETSKAKIETGSGGLVSVTANIALAYGRSSSVASVQAQLLNATNDILVGSYGYQQVSVDIANLTDASYYGAAVMVGLAFAQGEFVAGLTVPNGAAENDVRAKKVTVEVVYNASAKSLVTPSAGGVSVNAAGAKANVAVALVSVAAAAFVDGGGTLSAQEATVQAKGTASSLAEVRSPQFQAGVATIAVNAMLSRLAAVQKAYILGARITGAGAVKVLSEFNKDKTSGAVAKLNSNGGSASVGILDIRANIAVAIADSQSFAFVAGAPIGGGTLEVKSEASSIANAKVNTESFSASYLSVGMNALFAYANGKFAAYVATAGAEMTPAGATVSNIHTAKAEADTAQAPLSAAFDYYSAKINLAVALTGVNAEAALLGEASPLIDLGL